MQISYIEYFKLFILLSLWCFFHSAMISLNVTHYLKQHVGNYYRYYRLVYNSIAVLSLIPLIWYKYTLQTEVLYNWNDSLRAVQIILIGIAITLFVLGARKYDSRRFLGLTQINEDKSSIGITQSGELDTSGILDLIRHPWYTGLLLILWARPADISTLILNTVFTVYLFIGAHLEERKLIDEFGDTYRQYQNNVSMLFPAKWLIRRLRH